MASITIAPAQVGLREHFAALFESIRRIWGDGKECPYHPGHRDKEETVGNALCEQTVCSACFDEGWHND
jgi:hypothetical protein